MVFGKLISIRKDKLELKPRIDDSVFIAPNTVIIGDVKIERLSSIWYGTVIRGDVNWIEIGQGTNIQDLVVIHAETASYPTFIGSFVTVGHKAVLHGCVIKDFSLIGIGAIIMNGAEIGPFSIIGAGALVTERSIIPPGTLAVGVPAKVKRELTKYEIEMLRNSAQSYIELAKLHNSIYK